MSASKSDAVRTARPPATQPASAFTHEDFGDIYPPGIERHYWNHARNRIVYGLVRRLASPRDLILDIGCGTGLVTSHLRRRGLDCHGCDLGSPPPCDESVAPHLSLGVDACDLDPALRSRVQVILLLDVLEHLQSPRVALARFRDAFPSLRHILFTLPARMELWSNYDERNRHYIRYDHRTVHTLADPKEFELVTWSYFFHALYLPARLLKALGIDRRTRHRSPTLPWLHSLMAGAFVAEHALFPRRLPGSSIHGVLRCIR